MDQQELENLKTELNKAKSYLILKDSEAGKELITSINKDIDSKIESLLIEYRTCDHTELVIKILEVKALKELINNLLVAEEKVSILQEEFNNLTNKYAEESKN